MSSREDYLRSIYQLTDGGEEKTTTSELSNSMEVSDASASEAVKKLEKGDLVCRAEYRGFTLSPMGKEKGRELADKHEKLEKFFSELGLENPEEEADRVEHSISSEAVEKLENLGKGN
ncbi:MAG: metal-dependent transcriptional regulator [Candidatus Nanosalina sp.]